MDGSNVWTNLEWYYTPPGGRDPHPLHIDSIHDLGMRPKSFVSPDY